LDFVFFEGENERFFFFFFFRLIFVPLMRVILCFLRVVLNLLVNYVLSDADCAPLNFLAFGVEWFGGLWGRFGLCIVLC
jgi:hypothetical protein